MSKFFQGRVVNLKRWTERLHSLHVEAPIEPFKAGQAWHLARRGASAQVRTFMHRKGAVRAIFFERCRNTMKEDCHGRLAPEHPQPY